MQIERDVVSLDSAQLLGFRDIAKVAGANETPTVEELSRVLSKSGVEQVPLAQESPNRKAAQPE
jgi:hypothetical protein